MNWLEPVLGFAEGAMNIADLPASSMRDLFAGQNPLDQWAPANWTTSEGRASGRDVLRNLGLAGQEDTWGNYLGGLAAETVLDPINIGSLARRGIQRALANRANASSLAMRAKGFLPEELAKYAIQDESFQPLKLLHGTSAPPFENFRPDPGTNNWLGKGTYFIPRDEANATASYASQMKRDMLTPEVMSTKFPQSVSDAISQLEDVIGVYKDQSGNVVARQPLLMWQPPSADPKRYSEYLRPTQISNFASELLHSLPIAEQLSIIKSRPTITREGVIQPSRIEDWINPRHRAPVRSSVVLAPTGIDLDALAKTKSSEITLDNILKHLSPDDLEGELRRHLKGYSPYTIEHIVSNAKAGIGYSPRTELRYGITKQPFVFEQAASPEDFQMLKPAFPPSGRSAKRSARKKLIETLTPQVELARWRGNLAGVPLVIDPTSKTSFLLKQADAVEPFLPRNAGSDARDQIQRARDQIQRLYGYNIFRYNTGSYIFDTPSRTVSKGDIFGELSARLGPDQASDLLRTHGYDSILHGPNRNIATQLDPHSEISLFDPSQIFLPYIAPALQPVPRLISPELLAYNALQQTRRSLVPYGHEEQ